MLFFYNYRDLAALLQGSSFLAKGLGYGETSELTMRLEEVSKLPEAYASVILNSGF
jgi:hypothetical protein